MEKSLDMDKVKKLKETTVDAVKEEEEVEAESLANAELEDIVKKVLREQIKDKPKKRKTQPWKPASVLDVIKKEPHYRYRWCRANLIEKKMAEGWVPIRATNASKAQANTVTLTDGSRLDSLIKRRNLILCKMPEEMAEAREEYFSDLTKQKTEAAITEDLKNAKSASGAGLHGEVKIQIGEE